ncbi:Cerevisin [Arthrobotrys entomopaga]|nr:Cerevisin [Arthrobotrys entomopaga]
MATVPSTLAAPARASSSRSQQSHERNPAVSSTTTTNHNRKAAVVAAASPPKSDHNGYLVVVADHEERSWDAVLQDLGVHNNTKVKTFGKTVRMFSMDMSHLEARGLASYDNIKHVEKNYRRRAMVMPSKTKPKQMGRSFRPGNPGHQYENAKFKRQADAIVEQTTAPWGLERISAPGKVIPGDRKTEDLFYKYKFDRLSGAGVDVYVLDTGINVNHVDFGGRAKMVFSAFNDMGEDENGHGTHTAGTIGSLTYGVAKNVNLLGVKILDKDGEGDDENIAAGIDAVIDSHEKRKTEPGFMGSVISMSLGGIGTSVSLADIVRRASQAGIHIAAAAGNDGTDACRSDPGRLTTQMPVITVGATDIEDKVADFSNWGKCVDVHAPGVSVVSTWKDGNRSIKSEDGTSMAAPHVAGMIATELARNGQFKLDPVGMKKMILNKSLNGTVAAASKTPTQGMMMLLNTGMGAVGSLSESGTTAGPGSNSTGTWTMQLRARHFRE